VELHSADAFEVEFVAASGKTQAVVTLAAEDVRHVDDHDLVSVRHLERAAG
jgi:pyridoxine 5'-phosphate synthase PdxJ